MYRNRFHLRLHGYWTLIGILTIVCGAPLHDDLSTVQKLQNTIKAMETLLEKQQQRMLSGFEGMRRRVNALEKIADKTRKEIEHSANAICPTLTAPVHGRVLGGRKRSEGDLAYYVCGSGFEIKGNEETVCMGNGTWSGNKPVCTDSTPLAITGELRKSDCVTVDGESHACSCPIGFQLSKDQTTCTDVDECANILERGKRKGRTGCLHKCRNLPGSYQCICPSGYNVDEIQGCRDINECASADTNNCSSTTVCLNVRGGYRCISNECPPYYIKTGARLCQKMPCSAGDESCLASPYSITYFNMATNSKIRIPSKIFRLTTESGIDGSITRFTVVPGEDSFYFTSRRVDRRTGWLVLHQRPIGPKTLKVDFQAREHQRNGKLIAVHMAKVVVFISEYVF